MSGRIQQLVEFGVEFGHGTRIVAFRDGLVVANKPVASRRTAEEELANLVEPAEAV